MSMFILVTTCYFYIYSLASFVGQNMAPAIITPAAL